MKFKLIRTLSCLVAVACVFLLTVSASAADRVENGMTIIDYNDYVTDAQVDGDKDVVTVSLPPYMYGYIQKDHNGQYMTDGVPLGSLYCVPNDGVNDYASVYYPGSGITKTYMDLSNIPDGSSFNTKGKVWIEFELDGNVSSYVIIRYYCCIDYFDSSFVRVGYNQSSVKEVTYQDGAYVYELPFEGTVDKPDGAVYCATFFSFEVITFNNNGSPARVWFDFDRPSLKMSISSLYRLQEQTGKTNELLKDVLNGTPEQNESADNAAGQMGEQAEKIDGLIDQATPERPNLDAFDRTEVVPNAGVSVLTSTLSAIINNELVVKIMLMVATLMLVGYVLFGKKGG